ncbi:MAG: hypothetical protein CG446_214 [Methanosaeta sp. ASO1]|nr:MAG: hypothetical protein CG446_214 [Methanosaeta sp. ASO1]
MGLFTQIHRSLLANNFSQSTPCRALSLCRPAQDLHELLPSLLADQRGIDPCPLRCRDLRLAHRQQILIPSAQDGVYDLSAKALHLFLLIGRELSRRCLQPQRVHAAKDISLEVNSHRPVLISGVECEGLLSVVNQDQIALARSTAQTMKPPQSSLWELSRKA